MALTCDFRKYSHVSVLCEIYINSRLMILEPQKLVSLVIF